MRWFLVAVAARCAWSSQPECGSADTAGIVAALNAGDLTCAGTLARSVSAGDVNVNEVMMVLRTVEGKLKDIKEAVKATENDPLKFMAPAHQWAQSGSEIFISVKFTHKWDAPATLVGAEDIEAVTFEKESVVVKANKGDKRFILEIPLLREARRPAPRSRRRPSTPPAPAPRARRSTRRPRPTSRRPSAASR